ncbi:MAG: adenylate/guanylate cyclase domain-containing protein [Opitutaceae bacterium]|nr:adenylate/guanylate cyclase domain-containing protein [Opitutaceae bacterium]
MFRFRSYRLRLLFLILALTGSAQLLAFLIVARVHRTMAEREIQRQLDVAAVQLARVVKQRNADLARGASVLSYDAGLRETLSSTDDIGTLRSVLENFQGRVGAGLVALLSTEGSLLAETRRGLPAANAYQPLQQAADEAENAQASGYAVVDDILHSLVVVPLRAPNIVAWVVVGFPLDQQFIAALKETTGVEVTLRHGSRTLATTNPNRGEYLTRALERPTTDGGTASILLQYSLDEKLAPARRLQRVLGFVFAGSLVLAALLAMGIARNVSEPVQHLAAHTRKIAAGDYETRVDLHREDELGQLAASFNAMAAGLAERDRVRDLLDKNVSPEVAAQLLRDGAALGGDEREVTILFADLRGFTTLSEKLAPRDLLALLNRYLDRMSGEIERQGGVIDKFIGDAIMALFGAPVPQPDAADRALAAAVAMEHALAELNLELARDGHPPLALGIGVNTARVIAGNIGSHRRLNYSVLGDGVNVASRLQSLTRTPEFDTNVITSAATIAALRDPSAHGLRPLGRVQVKGRSEPVEIFAAGSPSADAASAIGGVGVGPGS